MAQKFYEKASVQTAIISGMFLLLGISIPYIFRIPKLQDKISVLEKETFEKTAEIQRLETLLAPFRTIALEKYTGTEAEALSKLALKIKELESDINMIKDYSYMAQLNILGLSLQSNNPVFKVTSPLSKTLDGCFEIKDDQVTIVYTPEAEKKFLNVIEKYPDFPFSYYGLAKYYKQNGNPKWKTYAEKAIKIFDQTTQIKGHNPQHDQAKQNLLYDLSEK